MLNWSDFITDRTVTQIDEDRSESKVEKWTWIAIDAIKQCGSTWLPKISDPIKPSQYLATGERTELSLIASLQSGAKHPRVHFREFAEERGRRPKSISVWVGPEGDFTPAEVKPGMLGAGLKRSDEAYFRAIA